MNCVLDNLILNINKSFKTHGFNYTQESNSITHLFSRIEKKIQIVYQPRQAFHQIDKALGPILVSLVNSFNCCISITKYAIQGYY